MAVKRKQRKQRFNPVVRNPSSVRLKAADETSHKSSPAAAPPSLPVPADALEYPISSEDEPSSVMLVITIVGLIFIGFIAWCVSQMPEK